MNKVMIGWTTIETEADAKQLAKGLIQEKLVACAQVDGPMTSIYSWEGKIEESQEYRLTLKFPAPSSQAVEEWLIKHHPYDTPQWLTFPASHALETYSQWAYAVAPGPPKD